MNVTTEQVRETFDRVARTTPVPAFDEVAFRQRVRRGRRRTQAFTAAATAAAVAAMAFTATTLAPVGSDPGDDEPPVATKPRAVQELRPSPLLQRPLYYLAGGRLSALTTDGTVHDLGLRSEAIIGDTGRGVLALDDESRVVRVEVADGGRGDGSSTFTRVQRPVAGPVSSVALSDDGRWLAWLDLEGTVRVSDLESPAVTRSVEATANSYVAAVSERAVLVSEDGDLVLRSEQSDVAVPTAQGGYGWQADTVGDRVSVMDRDNVTRLYDTSSGEATLRAEVPGNGRLSPDGLAVATVNHEDGEVRVWSGGRITWLSGQVAGIPDAVGWLDEGSLVLTSRVGDDTVVQVCAVPTQECDEVLTTDEEVGLSE